MPQAQQLGRYHLLDRIAFGGMAEIFRAKTFDSGGQVHLVAVKRVLAHLVEDQDFLQMLVDEAKISALLRHENIARLYEFAKAGDEYFLAMEYIDGKDLRSVLERGRQTGRPIPPEHCAWVAMETAHALHAAHVQRDGAGRALRIVHRDVSPSNVLCSYHGEVKLCDFGIAKATLTRVQTKTGVIKGKVKYMSPEQAMGRKLDHRSDLFSLGTVMYEMLTLQAPFQAPTEIELIFAVRDARKTPVRELAPDCPEELSRIVDKAMTRSRAARYQSGEDLALDLRIFLDKQLPGYRRSHFSRYMRKVFEEDIEKELRQLEGFEIGQADGGHIGVNLIAEALGPDAPFTRFTPVFGAAHPSELTNVGTSNFPHIEAVRPSDLHGQPTMMLDRAALGLPPAEGARADPASSSAPSADFAPADSVVPTAVREPGDKLHGNIHVEPTRILMAPAPPAPQPARSLFDQETGEKELPTVEGYRGKLNESLAAAPAADSLIPTVPRGPAVSDSDTDAVPKIDPADSGPVASPPEEASPDLHAQATRILFNPLADGAPTLPFDRHAPAPQGDAPAPPATQKMPELAFAAPPTQPTLPTTPVVAPVIVDTPGGARTDPTPIEDLSHELEEEDRTGEEEPTSVPLKDDDLEPA